ncbi:MAG TPA: DUF3108 domain-containing protein [Salinimicrobium sp.]|nr:DUF3108 domain-containing protein [Salinimicrobium sp.]
MSQKYIIALLMLLSSMTSFAQHEAFQDGEWFRFRIHYGVFNASFATMEVNKTVFNKKPVYHVVGKGKSTGMLHWFFKVDDNYETYIDAKTGLPIRFIRQIDEGGHTKDVVIDFNHAKDEALVFNRKKDTKKRFATAENVHDMLSAFYYLRNNLDVDNLEVGDETILNMFFDNENYPFKLKFLGREIVKTKMGKIACLKFRPYVMAGRVFKEEESLTFWVSDDRNRIPIKIEAQIAVGSLDADIDAYKGLKYPLEIIMD